MQHKDGGYTLVVLSQSQYSHIPNSKLLLLLIFSTLQTDEAVTLQLSATAAQVSGWLTSHRFATYLHAFQQYTGNISFLIILTSATSSSTLSLFVS